MEPISDSEITREYEIRRLAGLRQLARQINDEIEPGYTIDDVDSKDADHLYFAILNRIAAGVTSIQIPEYLGYGYHYDNLFRLYVPLTYRENVTNGPLIFNDSRILPYLLIRNATQLPLLYLMVMDYNTRFAEALVNLKNGSARDSIIDSIHSIPTNTQYSKFSSQLVKLMMDGTFDVLDIVYILLYTDDPNMAKNRIPYTSVMAEFRQYIFAS